MAEGPSYWLVKSEPSKYGFADLVRDGTTVWDGVRNPQAAANLRAMRRGDEVLYYHSQSELAVVGVGKVTREAFADPSDPSGRFVAVEIAALRALPRAVTLARMKAEPRLAGMKMLRQPRLSVAPVTPAERSVIAELGGEEGG